MERCSQSLNNIGVVPDKSGNAQALWDADPRPILRDIYC
ncbi:hypothetical protein BRAO375_3800025 [Bradyrhizobium sp. ORS 375]|nr:hypothetical protein BRAO375_3800025 [Bradyrhizobium sp. ORS 375]